MEVLLGIDIGGTAIKCCAVSCETGAVVRHFSAPTDRRYGGRNVLPSLFEGEESVIERLTPAGETVRGIGIAVPGPVRGRRTVDGCPNLGWGRFDVAAETARLTGRAGVVINDGDAACFGEWKRGAGRGSDGMVMITVGTGIGGGVIAQGRLLEGAFGAAGEIGHMPMTDDPERPCGCGKCGCLEQYSSATAIVRQAKRTYARGRENLTAKDVFDDAKRGVSGALAVVDEAAQMLGRALAFASCMVDPSCFVIGGGVSAAGSFLTDRVREAFRKYCFHPSRGAKFVTAALGGEAGCIGAALLAGESR